MGIVEKDGRSHTVITPDDELEWFKTEFNGLSGAEQAALLTLLKDEGLPADFYSKVMVEPDYIRQVVSMEQFLDDEYYLGNVGKTLYPVVKQDLLDLFSGQYYEVIASGSQGWGKTTLATVAMCRILYEMSCLRNPQALYGLEEGSEIALVCLSVTETLAKRAVFGGIKTKILTSRYFKDCFPYRPTLTELRFPGNIRIAAASSSLSSALSLNIFGGILDEANFMQDSPPQVQRIRYGNRQRKERGSHAETLYHMILRRMKTRYTRAGKLPGMLVVVSSKSHTEAFTEKRIAAAADNPSVFVRERSLWDAKGYLYSDEKFYVLVGNERIQSRMLKTDEEAENFRGLIDTDPDFFDCRLVDIPVDFKRDFQEDLETSLQDLAGIATVSISPFIQRREKIYDAVDETRSHPMPYIEWDPSNPPKINWDQLTRKWEEKTPDGRSEFFDGPAVNPRTPRHVHIDTSVKHDATGICIAHIDGNIDVIRRDADGNEYVESSPSVYVDFMLRVVPPPGDDIIMADVRSLLYSFIDHGYYFGLLTTDQFQSVEMRQYFEQQRGVETKLQSVDRTIDPYRELRSVLYENRISYYSYQPFLREIQRVIHDKQKSKIDHIPTESKDVSDAVAAVCFTLTQDHVSHEPIAMRLGISEVPKDEDVSDWIKKKESDLGPHEGNKSRDGFILPVMG